MSDESTQDQDDFEGHQNQPDANDPAGQEIDRADEGDDDFEAHKHDPGDTQKTEA